MTPRPDTSASLEALDALIDTIDDCKEHMTDFHHRELREIAILARDRALVHHHDSQRHPLHRTCNSPLCRNPDHYR